MPHIKVIDYKESKGELRQIYDDIIRKRGKLAEVHKIQSLNPPTIVSHMDLYLKIMFGSSPLSRAEREMMAVVVSLTNQCNYCIMHHEQALLHYWKDKSRIELLKADYKLADLTDRELLLCRFAEALTLNKDPEQYTSLIEKMKMAGLDDRAILDASLVVAYFNFVNRIVLSLDVKPEKDTGGYKY